MFRLSKKVVITIIAIPVVFFGAQYIFFYFAYSWYHSKIYPFYNLSISQSNDIIKVFSPGDGSGKIIQTINQNKKKIVFTLTGSNEEIKSINEFPLNGLVGYEMCYQNKYGEYCFGKTK